MSFSGILQFLCYSIHHNSYKIYLVWSRAHLCGLRACVCVCVCVCVSLRGVTSKCRDPRERVPRGVAVVWSLHISCIPCYAGLITLASSAAPWLPLCTDSCWPPSTNTLLLLPQSTSPFFCLCFYPSYGKLLSENATVCACVRVCVCVCVCDCWQRLTLSPWKPSAVLWMPTVWCAT